MNKFILNVNKWGRNNKGWSGGGRNEFIRNLHSYIEKSEELLIDFLRNLGDLKMVELVI